MHGKSDLSYSNQISGISSFIFFCIWSQKKLHTGNYIVINLSICIKFLNMGISRNFKTIVMILMY